MRIGTWNLGGRWSRRHEDLLLAQRCDLWLLTEIREDVFLEGFETVKTEALMASGRAWAGVLAPQLRPLPSPHPATAAAAVAGLVVWSSVLPWRSSRDAFPWGGKRHADWTRATMSALVQAAPQGPLVWGGDWNHALVGPEYAGSAAGRKAILEGCAALGLHVVTADLPHVLDSLSTIDHIAMPSAWRVQRSARIVAAVHDARLSDHDVYTIDVVGDSAAGEHDQVFGTGVGDGRRQA